MRRVDLGDRVRAVVGAAAQPPRYPWWCDEGVVMMLERGRALVRGDWRKPGGALPDTEWWCRLEDLVVTRPRWSVGEEVA